MATIVIAIGFSIYTLILAGTLIWGIKSMRKKYETNKELLKNGILTQAKITNSYQPPKKNKRRETDILDDELTSKPKLKNELIVTYQYKIKSISDFLIGTTKIALNFRNIETEKKLYSVGSKVDIFYLEKENTVSEMAHRVRLGYGDWMFVYINIVALFSSLFVLGVLQLVGVVEELDKTLSGLSVILGFLVYLFMLMGCMLIIFGVIDSTKKYFQYVKRKRKGIREKGKILKTWFLVGSKGATTHYIKYTYPAIAPFSLQTIINQKLNDKILHEKNIEICYLKEDKFSANIIGNKSIVHSFWLFLILSLLTLPFLFIMFYEFVLFIFF